MRYSETVHQEAYLLFPQECSLPTDQRNLPRSLADHLPVATPLSRKAIWADSEGFVSGGRRNPSAGHLGAPPGTGRVQYPTVLFDSRRSL